MDNPCRVADRSQKEKVATNTRLIFDKPPLPYHKEKGPAHQSSCVGSLEPPL